MRKKSLRVKAWAAALTIGCAAIAFPAAPISHAEDSIVELQSQYEKLEKQIKENQKKLKEKNEEAKDQKDVVSAIESQITDLNSQITILDRKINLLNSEIGTLSSGIEELDREIEVMDKQISETRVNIAITKVQIDKTYDKAIQRLSKTYMAGTASDLELLLGAKSMADILTWQQYIKNATEYDHEIIESLKTNIGSLQELETQLDATIAEAETKKAEAETQKQELEVKQADVSSSADSLIVKKNSANSKRNEAYAILKTMNTESKEYQQLDAQMRAEEERLDAELNEMLRKKASVYEEPVAQTTAPAETTTEPTTTTTTTTASSEPTSEGASGTSETAAAETTTTTTTTTKPATTSAPASPSVSPRSFGLICPIQNSGAYVSGTYPYYRSGGVHHGIDICLSNGKIYGHDIVAPQSGTVITKNFGDASRGNYFEIDHGNGLVTRYYHCSTILVSVGQTVTQGQVVAKVGDTGHVTGPHLHFEVLLNTKNGLVRQNPLDFITVP